MFSAKVINEIKSYVYAYIDPRSGRAFYIGQGRGNRAFSHLSDQLDSEKVKIIGELKKLGIKPNIVILRHGLNAEEAKLVESVCIDLAQIDSLSNKIKGKYSRQFGRVTVEEINRRYDAPEANVTEPCIAININETYKPGMSSREIYECTRGIWPVGPARTQAKFAISVYQEVILEVYAIEGWYPAGAVFSERSYSSSKRLEFVGNVAPILSKKYRGKSLSGMFSNGKRFPFRYLNMSGL